jgi:membrane fusion protein (multidrug efflux system)
MSRKLMVTGTGLLALFLLLGALFGTKALQFGAMGAAAGARQGPPPEYVSTALVSRQSWERALHSVGSVAPVQGVVLEAEVPGIVEAIAFENGQTAERGDLLVQFDVDVEKARLRSAKATLNLADLEYERAASLRESGTIPQSQLDRAVADLERARAEIENIEAAIGNKTVRAPFSGELGIRRVNLGQYVPQGAPIVTLQSFEQVYVNFSLPQQHLAVVSEGMEVRVRSDVYPDRIISGRLTTVSPEVDVTTRSVDLQATFDNEEGLLRSGVFVRVEAVLPETAEVRVAPATAILYAPYGNSVFVVERTPDEDGGEKTVVRQRFVRTGDRKGDFVSVVEGLGAGEEVVSAGVFKLSNGMRVEVNNEKVPDAELNPRPPNA